MVRLRSILAALLATVMVGTLSPAPGLAAGSAAEPPAEPSRPARMAPVPGDDVPVRPPASDPAAEAAAAPVPVPAALATDPLRVTLTGGAAQSMTVRTDALTVTVGGGASLSRNQRAAMTVDYSAVRNHYGADWAARLGLVDRATGEPVPAGNDLAAGELTAQVAAGGSYQVTATDSGGTGDYAASPLSPAGSWRVQTQGGGFSWSYDLRTPPVPGGLAPELSLSYSAAASNGRTASTNNQPSWIGEGFSMGAGSFSRVYMGCGDDVTGGNDAGRKCGVLWGAGVSVSWSVGGRSGVVVLDLAAQRGRRRVEDGT
jgi:hypothetical protein